MGHIDFVLIFVKVNKVTKVDSFPMPLVADALDSLAGASVFSSWISKVVFGRYKLARNRNQGQPFLHTMNEFLTMPFGLVNSGASFQRLVGHILKGLKYRFALIYIDDIIIFSQSVDEHLVHLEEVFRRLRDANVKLNPKKCSFVKE